MIASLSLALALGAAVQVTPSATRLEVTAGTTSERPNEKLVEAELWFVHKAPGAKETSQRQVVRMRDGGTRGLLL